MINKIVQTMADTMAGIKDGSVVLLGGFGSVGQPNALPFPEAGRFLSDVRIRV